MNPVPFSALVANQLTHALDGQHFGLGSLLRSSEAEDDLGGAAPGVAALVLQTAVQ